MADKKIETDDAIEKVDNREPFSEFELLALTILMDDTLVKLNLLKHVINKDADLISSSRPPKSSRPLHSQPIKHCKEYENKLKLEHVRKETFEIFNATLHELKNSGSFSALEKDVKDKKLLKEEEDSILIREAGLKKTVATLNEQLAALQHETESVLMAKDEEIVRLKTRIQAVKREWKDEEPKTVLECEERIRKDNAECIGKEEELWRQIQDLKISIEEELKSHEEISTFLENCKKELREKCEYLTLQYNADMKRLDKSIDVMGGDLENTRAEIVRLSALYEDYKRVIEEDREQEELQSQQIIFHIKETAAVKIQKWWRMHLVTQRIENAQKKKMKKAPKKKR